MELNNAPQFVQGTPDWVKPMIEQASKAHNIPTIMLSALLKQESGFNPNATSKVGAKGIAQFMPATAKGFGINPLDPGQAINAAAQYLRNGWDKYGKPELALAAYNAGGGNVDKFGGIPPFKETQNYVKSIMGMMGGEMETFNGPAINFMADAKKQQEKGQLSANDASRMGASKPMPNIQQQSLDMNQLNKMVESGALSMQDRSQMMANQQPQPQPAPAPSAPAEAFQGPPSMFPSTTVKNGAMQSQQVSMPQAGPEPSAAPAQVPSPNLASALVQHPAFQQSFTSVPTQRT